MIKKLHVVFIVVQRWLALILSPPRCVACKKFIPDKKTFTGRPVFCAVCDARLKRAIPFWFRIDKKTRVMVHAVCLYEEPVRSLVVQKRRGIVSASYVLAELIWQKTMFNTIACDVIVPVPLHWSRRFMRGFNQAREMGEVLAHKKKCACAELVRRTRHTAYQADLAVALRAPNVKNAFELTKSASRYRGTHMVLLDDVMTTGSTLRAVATVLLKIKPASLTIVVACRAPVNVNH